MLGKRRRQWASIEPTLVPCVLFNSLTAGPDNKTLNTSFKHVTDKT